MKAMLLAVALVGAVPASSVAYVQAHQNANGGFAEPSGPASPQLTAWAVLGLGAAGATSPRAARYIAAREGELTETTDVAIGLIGETVAGGDGSRLLRRLRRSVKRSGAIGPLVNSTAWGMIALRQAGQRVPVRTVRYLLASQAPSGGWPWARGSAPDSNDTAAAVQALRAAGVRVSAPAIRRGLRYLRRFQNRDGGFELTPGRGSDAQSTAWAIQAFLAAGRPAPRRAVAYLTGLRRRDGSYRYSARYVTTPVWVTAQVLPALARKSFPLR
ncbi:MAG: terpene cyclase/mutase family protein [Actinomycetota bacterium]|nr:terpene cyclase/mutase family protein [Actinomycetota bacterium]